MSTNNKLDAEHYYVGCNCPPDSENFFENRFAVLRIKATASQLTWFMGKWDAVAAAQQLNGMLRGLTDVQLTQLAWATQKNLAKENKVFEREREAFMWCIPKKKLDALLEEKINKEKAEYPALFDCDASAKDIATLVTFLSDEQRDQLVTAAAANHGRWWTMQYYKHKSYLEKLVLGRKSATTEIVDRRYELGAVVAVAAVLLLAMKKKAPPVKMIV